MTAWTVPSTGAWLLDCITTLDIFFLVLVDATLDPALTLVHQHVVVRDPSRSLVRQEASIVDLAPLLILLNPVVRRIVLVLVLGNPATNLIRHVFSMLRSKGVGRPINRGAPCQSPLRGVAGRRTLRTGVRERIGQVEHQT